jgi:hypothetical protein
MEWREENKIDDLVDNWQPPEVLKKYYSMGEIGFDKFGCNGIQRAVLYCLYFHRAK